MRALFFILLLILSGTKSIVHAQASLPDTINATFTNETIILDGHLNEPPWLHASVISNFTQRELHYGKPSDELTEVSVIYDQLALYIGVRCKQDGPVSAKYMQRDFLYEEDDNFQIALSTFNDKRNGYLFVVNPNGARADLLISGNEQANKDWNGVWDVRTSRNADGWYAEVRIPFNSLQFKKDTGYNWAINFERNIKAKNEQVCWQGWTRDCSVFCLSNAGHLSGLKDIGYARRFELKPFLLSGFDKTRYQPTRFPGKAGADLNASLSPTLKLNMTVNTDFAQVEADRIAVNLTRFDLYYPEKREFFLEGYQNYQFNIGGNNELFYTRKIGIEGLQPVNITAGGRLFGKVGKNNIGLLNIQSARKNDIPGTNNSVIRYKRDIGEQSYIGGIITSKWNKLQHNLTTGIDGAYATSRFLKNKNLVISALAAQSQDKGKGAAGTGTWRVFIDYPNDQIDQFIAISSVQEHFNPELGFLSRKNYDNLTWNLRINPRWLAKYGIRRMYLKPWAFQIYRTHTTGKLESFYNESRPIGFFTRSGERFEFNLQQQYDRLDSAFQLTDTIRIAAGKYWMQRREFQFGTFQGRRIWVDVNLGWGDFYNGRIMIMESSSGINLSRHLNFRADYILNVIRLSSERLRTHELAAYTTFAFNPRLDATLFTQWNSLDQFLFGNFRLHWIPNIGSDLYLVYNRGYDDPRHFRFMHAQTVSGAAKIVWRFTF